uniref:Uncharacterized protein n=1 Tax=Vespula pensylvanica TaxID=30213 RepID=A0A834PAB3_VESPE|nr:hypothetical protein H0235_002618 [Vespula pensylvanica]
MYGQMKATFRSDSNSDALYQLRYYLLFDLAFPTRQPSHIHTVFTVSLSVADTRGKAKVGDKLGFCADLIESQYIGISNVFMCMESRKTYPWIIVFASSKVDETRTERINPSRLSLNVIGSRPIGRKRFLYNGMSESFPSVKIEQPPGTERVDKASRAGFHVFGEVP